MKAENSIQSQACLLLAGCANYCPLATNQDPWYNESKEETPWDCAVHQQCVLPIPPVGIDASITMLQASSVVHITLQQARSLLNVVTLDPDTLLDQAAQEANAQAEKRVAESQMPVFTGETASKMRSAAIGHRQTATTACSLKGKLEPYLVRGLALNEHTGRFSAFFRNSTLWVRHDCLGRHAVSMKRRPVIVFLERAPAKVYVSVHMDE